MVKHIKKNEIETGIILFVEGETDKVFYEKLISSWKKSSNKIIIIINIRGIGNYQLKMINKIKNEIKPNYPDTDFSIVLCYDTDVFEFAPKPPFSWTDVEKKIRKECKIKNILHIKAEKMIEDWFIIDSAGICKFLGYSQTPTLKGNSGLDKIKNLFKGKNKIYQKGHYCYKFIEYLDMELIYNNLEDILKPLREMVEKDIIL